MLGFYSCIQNIVQSCEKSVFRLSSVQFYFQLVTRSSMLVASTAYAYLFLFLSITSLLATVRA